MLCKQIWTVYVTRVITGFNDVKHDLYTGSHRRSNVLTTRIINNQFKEGKNITGINVKNVNDQAVFPPFLSLIYFTVSITVQSKSCDTTTCQLALNRGSVVQFTWTDMTAGFRRLHVICSFRGSAFGLKNGVWAQASHKEDPQTYTGLLFSLTTTNNSKICSSHHHRWHRFWMFLG